MANVKEFSIEEKLISLIELQKIDCKLDQILKVRGELPLQVKDIEDNIVGLKNKQTKIEEDINGIKEFIVKKQENIKILEVSLKKYEKQISSVKNSREYEALETEIKNQTLDIKLSEKHISNANEDLRDKLKDLDTIKKQIAEKNFFLGQKTEELEAIIKETEKEEKHYNKKAETIKVEIDEKLLRAYTRIRRSYKNGMGIVSLVRSACGGCFSSIPPQKQSEIKQRKNIIICENCGRILVDEELFQSVKVK